MKKTITFFKKQKIFIFLILILLILIILKLFIKTKQQPKEQIKPPPLKKEKELITPSKKVSPEKKESKSPMLKEEEKPEIPYDPVTEALKEALEERSWLLDLPIKEKNYIIDYLADKEKFRVLMKIDITSPLSREEQINNIKTNAPKKLKEIGIDLTKQKIYYTFTP